MNKTFYPFAEENRNKEQNMFKAKDLINLSLTIIFSVVVAQFVMIKYQRYLIEQNTISSTNEIIEGLKIFGKQIESEQQAR